MRAVVALDGPDGLRTWELIEPRHYFRSAFYGPCVDGVWVSGLLKKTVTFPTAYVQVVA